MTLELVTRNVGGWIGNNKGAELVEWAIWVGVIAAAAVAAGAAVGPPLINLVSTMLAGS